MLRTPLKNSKNVSKPFKSPFDSPAQIKEQKLRKETLKKEKESASTPLSTRTLGTKRILLLEDDEKVGVKKPKLMKFDDDDDDEKPELEKPGNVEKPKSAEGSLTPLPEKLKKRDLLMLKKKLFEVRQKLDSLKSREQCAKKNSPDELKQSINKWKTACQDALEILCSEIRKKNDQSCKIADVLKMLGIPETIVNYSEKDDSFV